MNAPRKIRNLRGPKQVKLKTKPDPELITELNDLENIDQFVRVHSSTESLSAKNRP